MRADAMLQARGAIKHVGVTNFDVPRLQEMLDTGVKIISNQVCGSGQLIHWQHCCVL